MPYEIVISKSVIKELNSLPTKIKVNVIQHIQDLADEPRPKGCKKLVGQDNLWRIRVGQYRVIYSIEDNVLTIDIVRVRHRKDVYE
jgi:mRNA interferase RelE/StbE